jgi:G:T-mismatch repair DNA endonuclease (very short patch repair protein)
MKNKIIEIINIYPKHYSRMISKDPAMKQWVDDNTLLVKDADFSAHIYSAVNQETNICANNNQKRFTGINSGFGFCGKASACKCCYDSVSESVKKSNSKHTKEQKRLTQDKREKTSLERYGVTNNGQTNKAKTAHHLLYQDAIEVEKINSRIKNTKKINHGNETFNNREKASKTYKQKYGYENPVHLKQMNQNKNLVLLRDKDSLEELYNKFTVEQISNQLEVHQQTVYRYLNLHQLREPYTSTFEKEITNYLNELGITNIVSNTRKLISKEIDIYLPDYNLAIEYNGVYWHHDQIPHIDKYYHHNKFKECEDKGIELFTIFSDSWETSKIIWKNKIKQKLGLSTDIVYARKCMIREIDPKETRRILDENHVQGYCTAQIALGLYHNDELVAVMTFSSKEPVLVKIEELNHMN